MLNADKHEININYRRSRNRDTKEEEEKGEEESGGGIQARRGGDGRHPSRGGERAGKISSSLVDGAFNNMLMWNHSLS